MCATVSLSGCNWFDNEALQTSPKLAQDIVDTMTYVRAKNGLCFGVSTISRLDTGGKQAENQVVTWIDCKAFPQGEAK